MQPNANFSVFPNQIINDSYLLHNNIIVVINPLKTMIACMRQGNKYVIVCKQIMLTLPPFTL